MAGVQRDAIARSDGLEIRAGAEHIVGTGEHGYVKVRVRVESAECVSKRFGCSRVHGVAPFGAHHAHNRDSINGRNGHWHGLPQLILKGGRGTAGQEGLSPLTVPVRTNCWGNCAMQLLHSVWPFPLATTSMSSANPPPPPSAHPPRSPPPPSPY